MNEKNEADAGSFFFLLRGVNLIYAHRWVGSVSAPWIAAVDAMPKLIMQYASRNVFHLCSIF